MHDTGDECEEREQQKDSGHDRQPQPPAIPTLAPASARPVNCPTSATLRRRAHIFHGEFVVHVRIFSMERRADELIVMLSISPCSQTQSASKSPTASASYHPIVSPVVETRNSTTWQLSIPLCALSYSPHRDSSPSL